MDFIESVYSDIPEDWDNMYDIYVEVKDICMGEELFYTEDDGISACLRGLQKSSGGFIWKYKEL